MWQMNAQGWYPVSMTTMPQPKLFAGAASRDILLPSVTDDYLSEVARDWNPLRPTAVFATYWYFAAARQHLFYQRLLGHAPPWTADQILQTHRFTNAYRASDRVSQYLIRQVLDSESNDAAYDARDALFRILLFKLFNRVETWRVLERSLGELSWRAYSFDRYDAPLTEALERGDRIFSGAYIMPSGTSTYGSPRKHRNCLRLLEMIISEGGAEKVSDCRSLREVFQLLRSYPMMGDFLAFQFAIDINYSHLASFEENTFVVAGPGARDGIAKCFANASVCSSARIVEMAAERQVEEFERLGLQFQSLWGRRLQLIDCQNLFCEVGKYARLAHPDVPGVSGRTRIKQVFRPEKASVLPPPIYPSKWGINIKIAASMAKHGIMP